MLRKFSVFILCLANEEVVVMMKYPNFQKLSCCTYGDCVNTRCSSDFRDSLADFSLTMADELELE